MSLISGRPISFQMDLYQPLYVSRPSMQLELFASLRPVAYSGDLTNTDIGLGSKVPLNYNVDRIEEVPASGDGKAPIAKGRSGGVPGRKPHVEAQKQHEYRRALEGELREGLDLGRSVTSSATASRLGDFFQYAI